MTELLFREATRSDVSAILALLKDDALGQTREGEDLGRYEAAFDKMQAEGTNSILVADRGGTILATCQLTFISGLSLRAARRAQIESVRVRAADRGQGIGEALLNEATRRARAAGCSLIQLTMNKSRNDAQRFYQRLGFTPSHIGFKRDLT